MNVAVPAQDAYFACGFLDQSDEIGARVFSQVAAEQSAWLADSRTYGETNLRKDIDTDLLYLAEAVASKSPALFRNYVEWTHDVCAARSGDARVVKERMAVLDEELRDRPHVPDAGTAAAFVRDAIRHLDTRGPASRSPLDGADQLAPKILGLLLRCRQSEAIDTIDAAAAEGMELLDIYLEVFQPLLREVGRLWQQREISVAQEHYCSAAIQLMMGRLSRAIFSTDRNGHALVAACVGNELHEIGMRMVADVLELSGWNTCFLGSNVPANDLIGMMKRNRADVLCLSVTLTIHLPELVAAISKVRQESSLRHVSIIVGGYPFNVDPGLWRRVGADGYAADASSVVAVCADRVN